MRELRQRAHRADRERGSILLFSVAILGLLALFSVVFARLMSLERRASAYYADRVRAKLAARAGIERAVVNLQAAAARRHWSAPWTGPWDVGGDRWGYRLIPPGGLGQRPLDLHTTTRPSYWMADPKGRTRLGETLTYSGDLGEPYAGSLLIYRLKILDAASMVNLNQPDGAAARRMLETLIRTALPARASDAANIARKVIRSKRQQPKRFSSKPQVGKALMEAGLTEAEWLHVLRDLVTVHSWEDPTVVRPWNLNTHEAPDPPSDPVFKPLQRLTTMPRAPININTAREPVLVALFSGARARTRYGEFALDHDTAVKLAKAIIARRGGPKQPTAGSGGTTTISESAGSAYRPFRTWFEFETFVDELADDVFATCPAALTPLAQRFPSGSPDTWPWPEKLEFAPPGGFIAQLQSLHKVGHRDLVKAICNPNTMVNKFGHMPNHGGWRSPSSDFADAVPRLVDKTDLISMTTEACFDSMGVYEITSAGMILIEDERTGSELEVLAAHTDQMIVQVYRPLRLTTQQDFERHRAVMIAGNFIEAPEAIEVGGQRAGLMLTEPSFKRSLNQLAFFEGSDSTDYNGNPMPVPGWPGMVSWPQYSLDRDGTRAELPPKDFYPMADWDGHLTLSNMITVRTGDSDFIAGFARGRLDAFKARAWWEPRDIEPDSRRKLDPVAGAAPPPPFPPGQEIEPLPAGYLSELGRLTRPLSGHPPDLDPPFQDPRSRSPRVRNAVNPAEASVLGEAITDATTGSGGTTTGGVASSTRGGAMFTRGSQLLNTGVLIAPDRVDDSGEPRFLAYDGDNIDLVRGTTIRFWVQPLRDPFAQEVEVLLSFMGSNGAKEGNAYGKKREAGFRVIKEVLNNEVYITLEALGTDGYHGAAPDWASELTLANTSRVRVKVTPDANNPKNDPTQPQWIPGTWHWVVVNLGLGFRGIDADEARGFHQFATLQVDKAPVSPPLAFRGDDWGKSPVIAREFGELYGHVFNELSTSIEPINATSALRDFSNPAVEPLPEDQKKIQRFWFRPRVLGDYYHCQSESPAAAARPSEASGPVKPPYRHSDFGEGVVVVRKTREYGKPPSYPPLDTPDDAEYPGAITRSGSDVYWFPFVPSGTAGTYVPVVPPYPVEPHPVLSFNRQLKLRFYLKDGSDLAPFATPYWNTPELPMRIASEDNPSYVDVYGIETRAQGVKKGQWYALWPSMKHEVYGPDPKHEGDLPRGVRDSDPKPYFLYSKGYPGGEEWHISVVAEWDEAHYTAGSPYGNHIDGGTKLTINGVETVLPPDPRELPSVEMAEPRPAEYQPNGEGLPYSVHNSGQTTKGAGTKAQLGDGQSVYMSSAYWENPQNNRRSFIRTKRGLEDGAIGVSLKPIPLDLLDDDCHGCEDCDVDGPVFIGGEPHYEGDGYADNYLSVDGALQLNRVNKDTMAYAVFDNVVFLNGDHARRTDSVGSTDDTALFEPGGEGSLSISLAAKNFEDRFYEEDLEAFLINLSKKRGEEVELGTGAVYHRALMELRNTRVRLGSLTWTAYPTSYDLDYEVGLWKFRNTYNPATERYAYTYLRRDPVTGQRIDLLPDRDAPHFGVLELVDGQPAVKFQSDPAAGVTFSDPGDPPTGFSGTRAYLDGLGGADLAVEPQELLILGVRLRNLGATDTEEGSTRVDIDPSDPEYQDLLTNPAGSQGVVQSPVLETPILEDVTLNVITARPVILYAEEGADE